MMEAGAAAGTSVLPFFSLPRTPANSSLWGQARKLSGEQLCVKFNAP